jgi:predicted alpha/beta-hydrolase family hydrolase
MLAAADPGLVDGLLLLSYPLHPPNKPAQLRTSHFSELRTAALFVHGSRDPFGTLEEMKSALNLIPAPTSLFPIEGAGHDLNFGRGGVRVRAEQDRWAAVIEAFQAFIKK